MDASQPILAFIGPSAAGKSSVIAALTKRGLLVVTPTWTTRPPRAGEAETSLEHVFVSEKEFTIKDQAGFFIKTGELFNLPYRFGLPTLASTTTRHISTVVLRAALIKEFTNVFPNTTVYQITDSAERVRSRLLTRQSSGERLAERLMEYQQEVIHGGQLASRTFMNDSTVNKLADTIAEAIRRDFTIGP